MESQVYDRLVAEYSCSLQKCEDILLRLEMEITPLKSEINSRKERSRSKKFNASSSKQASNDKFRLVNKTSVEDGMSRQREMHRIYELQESCQSSMDFSSLSKGKGELQCVKIECINKRLKIMEEEMKTTKQAFFSTVKERTELVNEIYQKFQAIQHHLCLSNEATGEPFSYDACIVNPRKDERSGLPEVLCKDSNPSIIIREHRATSYLSRKLLDVHPHIADSSI
ncbi:Calcium-binding EF-hand family protein isoform 1 [Quillaja saponaria]|uniref:Calcium-binding EF-hand family protein isoform 1 n=1 Tax=Quillaja saponaria TaxID=32244 RepID=A0AAD7L5G5_QUISA|nr:Calcium-binding EF-hand family protein isoform 1 [Quillaja saponaria]KAJ7951933.1 Calcium-binding EF-hand family protein isoform 1 [Quillaja saponaria]